MPAPLRFREGGRVYVADSCEPLKRAARAGELELKAWGRGSYPGTPFPPRRAREVRSVGVWDARRPQSWGLPWHTNEGLELTYVARGRVPFAVEGRAFHLTRGALTITRPWQPHRLGDPALPANRLVWIILDVGVYRPNQAWVWPDWLLCSREDRARLATLLRHNDRPVFPADRRCADAFESLAELLGSGGGPAASETLLKLTVNEILVATLRMLERQDLPLDRSLGQSQRLVREFLRALPGHLDEHWTLASMAEACGLHRTRFAHHCRQITSLNPVALLNARRLEAARRLLLEAPQRSVTEVALSCGFGSSQYFATRFRRDQGLSPRQYRARGPARS
ncbi:MAG TPA: AraC family transcriptional regulator [Anaeromyxobacter sp.]|nr:AraC family transcriptional regulator [Anaeromyxobacter sp.]